LYGKWKIIIEDAWEQRELVDLFEENNERNEDKYAVEHTISIASMLFNPAGNGAAEASLTKYKVLQMGDVAFEGHKNKEFAYGRFVMNDIGNGIMSPRFTTLRPKFNPIIDFWKYYIHYEPIMKSIVILSTKAGTMMNELVVNDLLKNHLLVPNEEEQAEIGRFFVQLDDLITLHQREYDKTVNLKKAMLEKMFPKNGEDRPEIRFRGFTDAWEQRKLGDTVQITMGQSPDGSTYSDVPSDYILVQGNADLQNGWVTPRVWTTQVTKKAEAGDLIMSVRAPAGAMGKTAYNAVIGRGVVAIKGNEFIYQLLVKMNSNGYWKVLSCGSTFESLNSDNIKNAEVIVPKQDEQVAIGHYFRNFDNLITLHQRESFVEQLQE